MQNPRPRSKRLIPNIAPIFTLAIAMAVVAHPSARAQTLTALYTFTGGADGGSPYAGLALDKSGNVYGTTTQGGSGLLGCGPGCGTVFKVDTAGNETVLHNFGEKATDGAYPLYGSLFRDGAGNLYGTTLYGGIDNSGTIFRLTPAGTEAIASFTGANGGFPNAGLAPDAAGNGYGTTYYRGTGCAPYGCGTVFKVSSAGKITVVYSFTNGADGAYPEGGLVRDTAGNLYGTTSQGGPFNAGTVFKVDPTGKETVLYAFRNLPDGATPNSNLVTDGAGNLYGTTLQGGMIGVGTVFKIDPTGKETLLYSFCSISNCADGEQPFAGLVRDSAGNLFGTTLVGGYFSAGTVFEVPATGQEKVLYNFTGGSEGGIPFAGLVLDSAGNLYGTTSAGGLGYGAVFKISP